VTIIEIGALYVVLLHIIPLLNLQCNVPLTRGPSAIAESVRLLFISASSLFFIAELHGLNSYKVSSVTCTGTSTTV